MCQLAWRSGSSAADRTITSSGGSAADVPPSAATGAAVEPLIAGFAAAQPLRALHCTRLSAARLRDWRVTGGGDLAGAAPSEAQRSDLQAGQFAKRASFTRSVKESGPAIPGHGKGPPRVSAGTAGLTVFA
jgi:hypothetical protein